MFEFSVANGVNAFSVASFYWHHANGGDLVRGLKWLMGRSKPREAFVADAPLSRGEKLPSDEEFRPVKTGAALLQTAERQRLIRVLIENCPLSQPVMEAWWLRPLEALAARVQECPAAWQGAFSGPGGFLDRSLNVSACAVRLTRGMMLPPGATPEEQAEQVPGWLCAVYWAGLFHHLEQLTAIQGAVKNGRVWYPGLSVPGDAWRVRRSERPAERLNGAYIAFRLLPDAGLVWLQRWPVLSHTLLTFLSGNRAGSCLLSSIIDDACSHCGDNTSATTTTQAVVAAPAEQVNTQPNYTPPKLNKSDAIPLSSHEGNKGLSEPIGGTVSSYTPAPQRDPTPLSGASETVIPLLESALDDGAAIVSAESDTTDPDAPSETESEGNVLSMLDEMVEGGAGSPRVTEERPTAILSEETQSESQSLQSKEPERNSGELFLHWLKVSIEDGTLTVNESDSVLHVLANFVFLASPGCFYRFIKVACDGKGDKDAVQKNFESLGLHHSRNGRGLFHYHQYDSLDNRNRYTKVSGYMISADRLLTRRNDLADSQWISARK
ncbi:TraI domain-containing protein [Lonsdalea quercina]|uniref:TraI domain-containing protein n=1 Tax=Lonsdalea quercina TaxID=71657 RepID=UPI003F482398